MSRFLSDPLNPAFALAMLAVVTAVAWLVGRLVPFYARSLEVEGEARLVPLDGLRGVLCFGVMAHHAAITHRVVDGAPWEPPTSPVFLLLGRTSVDLFFCITGFLFWAKILRDRGSLPTWPFFRSRLFRIVPLYAFSAGLCVVVVARAVDWTRPSTYTGLARVASIGLRQWRSLGSVDLIQVDAGVVWSLQYEWGFYLLLPALCPLAKVGDFRPLVLLLLAMTILLDPGPIFFFAPGFVAAHLLEHPAPASRLRGPSASVVVLAAALALPILRRDGYDRISLALTTLVFVPIACGNSIFGILNWRGLRVMGLVSYSVYLLHGIALYIARPLLAAAKHDPRGDGTIRYWSLVALLAIGTLIASCATYRLVEWPFIRLERRFRDRRPTAEIVRGAVAESS